MSIYSNLANHEEELFRSLNEHMIDVMDEDLPDEYLGVIYQGFDQKKMRAIGLYHFKPESISLLATIGALRGSTKARTDPKLKIISLQYRSNINSGFSGKTIEQLFNEGILHKEKGQDSSLTSDSMTIQRLTHSFPDLAALSLFKLAEKGLLVSRVSGVTLPVHLQFPAAASLPLSEAGEKQVKDFCIAFSPLLKTKKDGKETAGTFNESIFSQQRKNEIQSVVAAKLYEINPVLFKEPPSVSSTKIPNVKLNFDSETSEQTENKGTTPPKEDKSSSSSRSASKSRTLDEHFQDFIKIYGIKKSTWEVGKPAAQMNATDVEAMRKNLKNIKSDLNAYAVANALVEHIYINKMIPNELIATFIKAVGKTK